MRNVFKRFGAKDTGSFRERYFSTRFRLTCIYSFVLVTLLIVSSGITRELFSERIERRFAIIIDRRDRVHSVVLPIDAASVRADLSSTLILVNGILVGISVVVSYWLASRTVKPIQEAYERQRQFLSDASHELRTPLAILQANLENEERSGSEEEKARAASHLEEVHRMSALVRDVLSLAKLENSEQSIHRVPVAMNAIVHQVVDRLAPIAATHGVSLIIDESSNPFTILAHEESMIRVLTNIVENAILYNRPHGKVTIALHREQNLGCIDVIDTGVGVADAEIQKIFDRFYRAEKSRSRRTGGSGLGLAIAREITESFGGTITMTSAVDVGTTVRLTFPIHTTS